MKIEIEIVRSPGTTHYDASYAIGGTQTRLTEPFGSELEAFLEVARYLQREITFDQIAF